MKWAGSYGPVSNYDKGRNLYRNKREFGGLVIQRNSICAASPGRFALAASSALTVYDNKRRADYFSRPPHIQLNYPQHLADQMEEPIHTPISEDCLYLNVWVSDLTTPKKGILFWIYGGSYAIGHASRVQSRGEAFVAAHPDIMVVAPNYRLGVFGSINLDFFDGSDQYRCSNNLNLLDQRAALQWVRENARLFGADPDTITYMDTRLDRMPFVII